MPLTELVHYFNTRFPFAPGRDAARRLEFCDGRVRARFGDRRLDSVFQPLIERASGIVVGHEAHLRVVAGEGQALPAQAVFLEAHDDDALVHVDRLVRTLHALNFLLQREQAGGTLALNVHPQLIRAVPERHGHVFESVLSRCGLTPERVVLELTDDGLADPAPLAGAITEYQARGYRIALDNFGRHSIDIGRLAVLAPDIVKLDRSLCGHAGHLALARRVPEGLVPEIRDLGMTIASQHIETAEQLQLAESLGVDWLQGHRVGRPAHECKPIRRWQNVRSAA